MVSKVKIDPTAAAATTDKTPEEETEACDFILSFIYRKDHPSQPPHSAVRNPLSESKPDFTKFTELVLLHRNSGSQIAEN